MQSSEIMIIARHIYIALCDDDDQQKKCTIWQWQTFHTQYQHLHIAVFVVIFLCIQTGNVELNLHLWFARTVHAVQKYELNSYSWIMCVCKVIGSHSEWIPVKYNENHVILSCCSLWQRLTRIDFVNFETFELRVHFILSHLKCTEEPLFLFQVCWLFYRFSFFTLIKMVNEHFPKVFPRNTPE